MGVRNNAGDTPCGAQVDSSPYLNPWKTQKSNDRHIYPRQNSRVTRVGYLATTNLPGPP
jgi:hypothetical protein